MPSSPQPRAVTKYAEAGPGRPEPSCLYTRKGNMSQIWLEMIRQVWRCALSLCALPALCERPLATCTKWKAGEEGREEAAPDSVGLASPCQGLELLCRVK